MTGRRERRLVHSIRRGKVQSHVLWRMLGSRVKGEKSIERAREAPQERMSSLPIG